MIRFSCRCGYVFEMPADTAGTEVQCPQCRVLNDVPLLGDRDTFTPEGTYKVDAKPSRAAAEALDGLFQIYAKGHVDKDGKPIDLRVTPEELAAVGEPDDTHIARPPARPRYDPETGELIRAIPVTNENSGPAPGNIPFAKPAISYAVSGTTRPRIAGSILLDLVQPLSLMTLFFVAIVHALLFGLGFLMALRLFIVGPGILVMFVAVFAHYGNVIDEIATEERDELPRLMRDLRFHEDVLWPFMAVTTTLLLCYAPAAASIYYLLPHSRAGAALAGIGLTIAGTVLVPAIALTLLTSGSVANLRPDRVLAVIRCCGPRYFAIVLAFVVAIIPYLWATAAVCIYVLQYNGFTVRVPAKLVSIPLVATLLCIGIFIMHYFCWHVGLLYRAHSTHFPWVGRVHVKEDRPPVERRKPKYV